MRHIAFTISGIVVLLGIAHAAGGPRSVCDGVGRCWVQVIAVMVTEPKLIPFTTEVKLGAGGSITGPFDVVSSTGSVAFRLPAGCVLSEATMGAECVRAANRATVAERIAP